MEETDNLRNTAIKILSKWHTNKPTTFAPIRHNKKDGSSRIYCLRI